MSELPGSTEAAVISSRLPDEGAKPSSAETQARPPKKVPAPIDTDRSPTSPQAGTASSSSTKKRRPYFSPDAIESPTYHPSRANSNPDIRLGVYQKRASTLTNASHRSRTAQENRKRPSSAGTIAIISNLTHIPKNIFNTVKSAVEKVSHSKLFAQPKDKDSVSVFVGTWNMNGRIPAADLNPFASALLEGSRPDLIAIGTQECLRSLAQALLITSKSVWEAHLERLLGPLGYQVLKYVDLGGVHLGVFCRRDTQFGFEIKGSGKIATGVGGVVANKGGVAVSLDCWTRKRGRACSCSFAFVASHFVAHQQYVAERNANFTRINKDMIFSGKDTLVDGSTISSKYDHIFWFGDLNYRLLIPQTATAIRKVTHEGNYQSLLEIDQLSLERKAERVFQGYEEGEITFPPTFKFLVMGSLRDGKKDGERMIQISTMDSPPNSPGLLPLSGNMSEGEISDTTIVDSIDFPFPSPTSYDSVRGPSYTDRILYRSNIQRRGNLLATDSNLTQRNIKCTKYAAAMEVVCSDHKPVWGLYDVSMEEANKRNGSATLSFTAESMLRRRMSRTPASVHRHPNRSTSSWWRSCCVPNKVDIEYEEPVPLSPLQINTARKDHQQAPISPSSIAAVKSPTSEP